MPLVEAVGDACEEVEQDVSSLLGCEPDTCEVSEASDETEERQAFTRPTSATSKISMAGQRCLRELGDSDHVLSHVQPATAHGGHGQAPSPASTSGKKGSMMAFRVRKLQRSIETSIGFHP